MIEEDVVGHEEITFRYCTEALITGEQLDKEKIRETIGTYGDSMVVAGSNQKLRIHIHTDTPWELFVKLGKLGTKTQEILFSTKYSIELPIQFAARLQKNPRKSPISVEHLTEKK